MRAFPPIAVLATIVSAASSAWAAPQTAPQRRCVNTLNKRGAALLKTHGRVAVTCLRHAAADRTSRLGDPTQEQTLAACLTNDVGGKITSKRHRVNAADSKRCAAPDHNPEFAYAGAAAIAAAAEEAALGLFANLFGLDANGAVAGKAADRVAAACQRDILKFSHQVLSKLWSETIAHKKKVLVGRRRIAPADATAPVANATELANELVANVLSDPRGKIEQAERKLEQTSKKRCTEATSPLSTMFPGVCAGSADATALAACAAQRARMQFWTTLASFDGLEIECDLLDDGLRNSTCGPKPWNVVLILSDDQGWADAGFTGVRDVASTIPTPNMDSLASAGLILDNFFVQPVCSPTRAEVLTGRSAARVGIAPSTVNPRNGQHMRLEEVTLAEAFQAAGYDTALVGKWHLGPDEQGPLQQGFDHFVGILRAAADYFTRKDGDELLWQKNGVYVDVPGYTTDLIAEEAVEYLAGHTAPTPFFLYVPFTAPHNPQQAKPEDVARVPAGFDPTRTTYAAMTISLDDAIGRILDSLDANGLAGNTVVFFASDNGGGRQGNNLPLRGGKSNTYDGGVRVPAAVRIPGVQGGRVVSGMIAAADLYPTLLSLAGQPAPPGPPLDGKDVSAGIIAASSDIRQANAWINEQNDAYRTPKWKLIRRADGVRELYDVVADPSESTNLVAAMPGTADELEAALDTWNERLGIYPSHIPPPQTGPAAPAGDVVRVVVDIGPSSSASGALLQVRLSNSFNLQVHPGDRLEYDMMIAPGSRADGFVLDLERINTDVPWGDDGRNFRDQDNHKVAAGEAFTAAIGSWARRTIGLGAYGTNNKNTCKLLFLNLSPGRYEVLLDNIVIRRFDGSDLVIYDEGPVPDLQIVDDGLTGVATDVSVVSL